MNCIVLLLCLTPALVIAAAVAGLVLATWPLQLLQLSFSQQLLLQAMHTTPHLLQTPAVVTIMLMLGVWIP
jgi:hypothetical protein